MMSDLSVFGNTVFVSSSRVQRISIKIQSNGLKVTLPLGQQKKEAIRWITENRDTILKKQQKLQQQTQKIQIVENQLLHTFSFVVRNQRSNRKDTFFQFRNAVLTIEYPTEADLQSNDMQALCWRGIQHFLKKEAKKILPEKLEYWATKHQFTYRSLKLQTGKTRWGSCSNKKNINLSVFLLLLPEHLIDYVILHELCHTVEMNHSENFWKLMETVTDGKAKKWRVEMKQFHIPH